MKLETNNVNAEFYLASLALGILEAMKLGAVQPEVGIWSLGRLQGLHQFEHSLVLSEDLKYVIGCFDEIDVWSSLDPKNGLEKQQTMIEELKMLCLNILKNLSHKEMSLIITLSMEEHDLD